MLNNKLNIKPFDLSKINFQNPNIVMIAKRNTGISYIPRKDKYDIEYELKIGEKNLNKK